MQRTSSLEWVAGEKTPRKIYITRVFNYGLWQEWQTLKRKFSRKQIEDAVKHPLRGQWTKRGKAFAETLFHCRMPKHVLISYEIK